MLTRFRNKVSPWKFDKAREMRNNPTKAESILWQSIRKQKLGVKFQRQKVMFGWIVDFWCPKKMLVIEVDGEYHNTDDRQSKDIFKDGVLNSKGVTVLRFTNNDVENNLSEVIKYISIHLHHDI